MAPARFYADASAVVKLFVPERESEALVNALDPGDELVSSDLLKVEATRAANRLADVIHGRPEPWLRRVTLLRISDEIRDRAAFIGPPQLRSLDAIHLATMEQIRDALDGLLSYDDRLIDAALGLGIPVLSPR